jgi:hypothetical protein
MVAVLLCIKECSKRDRIISDKDTLIQMNKYAFDTLRDSKGRLITKQKANEFNNRKTIEHLLDTIETVSKIKQQVKVVTRTIIKHDTLTLTKLDTITIDGTKINKQMV